jgi:hypothetical protein
MIIRKRNLVYLLIIGIFIVAVFMRKQAVVSERQRTVASVIGQWQSRGKPVIVEEVQPHTVPVYTKITASLADNGNYQAYVSRSVQQQLGKNQLVFLNEEDAEAVGRVSYVASTINFDTGLFLVKFNLNHPLSSNNKKATLFFVETDLLKDAICLPRQIVISNNGQDYVWIVKGNKAQLTPVLVGQRNGYGLLIKQGLSKEDKVVYQGYTNLSQGDKINILDNLDCSSIKKGIKRD